MSISDLIVVMKDGIVNQIGAPQDVYDEPVNLFVAKFLGTPPINVFDGKIKGGKVYIGEDFITDIRVKEDKEVKVGIRPEGFILSDEGTMKLNVAGIEVMGRDTILVADHDGAENRIRAVVAGDDAKGIRHGDTVKAKIRKGKVFVFDATSGERLGTEA